MYFPAEDTFLLIRGVKGLPSLGRVLEIGVGSGKVLEILNEVSTIYVGCDINLNVLKQTVSKDIPRTDLVCCDSAACFVDNSFDTIVFNPPYLPSESIVDQTVDGGKEGIEILLKFIKSSFRLVRKHGSILFISSSLANVEKIKEFIKENGFYYHIIAKEHFMFEDIYLFHCMKLL
ncbi:MAG: HemK2/MTQ2 family protein methyltransferase [Nitrososphaeria archaeon]